MKHYTALLLALFLIGCSAGDTRDKGGEWRIRTDGGWRATEAERVIRSRVPLEFISPVTVSLYERSEKGFLEVYRARTSLDRPPAGHRDGFMFPYIEGKAGDGIYILERPLLLPQQRQRLILHEYGHWVWHYLLLNEEWQRYFDTGGDPESFADDFADYCLTGKDPNGFMATIKQSVDLRDRLLIRPHPEGKV